MAARFESVLDRLRATWDERAARDPLGGSGATDATALLASGAELVAEAVAPHLAAIDTETPPAERRALDLGCGVGRALPALAEHFPHVHGVDVSPVMLACARALLPADPRITLHLGDGMTLQCVRRHRFDFALCHDVLAHAPDRALVRYLIRQLARRMKPGGVVALDLPAPAWPSAEASALLEAAALTTLESASRGEHLWLIARRDRSGG